MITVSPALEPRLDAAWGSLQDAIMERRPGISQDDLDELCTAIIETIVTVVQLAAQP